MRNLSGLRHGFLLYTAIITAILTVSAAGCGLFSPAKRELTAKEILDRAAEAAKGVTAAHFTLEVSGGAMQLGPGLQVSKGEGDLVRPGRLRMKVNLRLGAVVAESEIIAIGQELYLTNPLTKRWEKLPGGVAALRVLDDEHGVPKLLTEVAEPQKVGNETLDGVSVYHLSGTLPSAAIAEMIGGQSTDQSVNGELWIGADDFLLRQVRLEGAIGRVEKASVVRVLKLSRFNESVSIEPPL